MRLATLLLASSFLFTACASEAGNSSSSANASLNISDNVPENVAQDEWYKLGRDTLAANLAKKPIDKPAKNVILFIADGMDPTTVTAARIFDGQSKGMMGEENILSFETMPHLALSKTYNTNAQTPDSAGTATAMMTGVKTRIGFINVADGVPKGDCNASLGKEVTSAGELAERAGMAVGVISTARLTHATPATVYAHSPERGWETDADIPADDNACKDIARQMIEWPHGDGLEVALGGGRRSFLPTDVQDPESDNRKGRRKDGRNLTEEWAAKSDNHLYVWNKAEFDAAPTTAGTKLLGLFENSHMQYEADRADDTAGEPSLAEMTDKALDILSHDEDGFFLMVEAGRVDHAHHGGNAHRALRDAQAFAEAIQVALDRTSPQETLIIVTADHGHTMSIQGYPQRGNPILGVVVPAANDGSPGTTPLAAGDGKPYTTLTYANGSGSVFFGKKEGDIVERPFVSNEEAFEKDYKQQALIPGFSETHGGQDVTIYASGPQAYLFDGTVEQNYIFHVMEYALQLNKRAAE
jgi:alkaline phosphatase